MPKLVTARVAGSDAGKGDDTRDPKLVGDVNEVMVNINGTPVQALLDTGSVVSIISETFKNQQLPETDIKPLDDILKIECADGEDLPYLGYITADLDTLQGLPKSSQHTCLFLVVPDTKYSSRTSIIIGTNILQELLHECEKNFGT